MTPTLCGLIVESWILGGVVIVVHLERALILISAIVSLSHRVKNCEG